MIYSGHIDPGESPLTAACRETMEETGLDSSSYEIFEDFYATLEVR